VNPPRKKHGPAPGWLFALSFTACATPQNAVQPNPVAPNQVASAQASKSAHRSDEPRPSPTSADTGPAELRKQCGGVIDDSCVQLAAKVSKTRPDAAVGIFVEACDANVARGCAELGTAYVDGVGLPQDGIRADAAFVKACRLDPLFCD
jgi:hypothetical protein